MPQWLYPVIVSGIVAIVGLQYRAHVKIDNMEHRYETLREHVGERGHEQAWLEISLLKQKICQVTSCNGRKDEEPEL